MLLPLLVGLAAQFGHPVAAADDTSGAPSPGRDTPSAAASDAPSALVDVGAPSVKSGTTGGVAGAAGGCAAGVGVPLLGVGAGSGLLYWLYSGAAAGTITGWTPALTALGTSGGMCGAALCMPMVGAGAATAGAIYGAQADGRDPLPALYGAIPGLGLAFIATTLGVIAVVVGVAGSIAAIGPVAILTAFALVIGLAAPPCTACGAGVADLVWGNGTRGAVEAPLAGTHGAASATATVPMKF